MTHIKCPLRDAAQISGRSVAIAFGEGEILYSQYDAMASATAAELMERGVCEGDRIGILMHPGWEQLVLLMAIIRVGAVACPLSLRLPPEGLRTHLALVEAKALVAPLALSAGLHEEDTPIWDPADIVSHSISDARGPSDRIPLDRPALVIFTSGSTGRPKAVLHSLGSLYYSARGTNLALRLRSEDRWLLSLPLYHVGGIAIALRCMLAGAAVVLPSGDETLTETLRKHRVSHLSLVATQLRRLLKEPGAVEALRSAKGILLGGGPTPPALFREASSLGLPLFKTYGLSEMGSQVTTHSPATPLAKRENSGRALRHDELRIAEDGEILVRGPSLFLGYIEGRSIRLPLRDGWFATGDVGRLDEDGFLEVTGRKDNLFISGGENIYPEEIEEALGTVPGVEQALVVPVDDEDFGQRPLAFVRMAPLDAERLGRELERSLPRFKHPARYLPWPSDPRAEALKPERRLFAEWAKASLLSDP